MDEAGLYAWIGFTTLLAALAGLFGRLFPSWQILALQVGLVVSYPCLLGLYHGCYLGVIMALVHVVVAGVFALIGDGLGIVRNAVEALVSRPIRRMALPALTQTNDCSHANAQLRSEDGGGIISRYAQL